MPEPAPALLLEQVEDGDVEAVEAEGDGHQPEAVTDVGQAHRGPAKFYSVLANQYIEPKFQEELDDPSHHCSERPYRR